MKYKCLVLDHDDTAVKSTPELHYPAFCEIMEILRPDHEGYSLAQFAHLCSDPGFETFCRNELAFTDEDMQAEYEIWKRYISDKTPAFYDGFLDMVREFKRRGGYVCVISLSENTEIIRHYRENGVELDLVFGWECPEPQRKPNPYPLQQVLKALKLNPSDCLVVDDLKLGYDMAKACGADFAAAGWSHELFPAAGAFMREHAAHYFATVAELTDYIFSA